MYLIVQYNHVQIKIILPSNTRECLVPGKKRQGHLSRKPLQMNNKMLENK